MSTEFSSHVIVPLTAITHVTCLKGEKKTFICSSLNLLINFNCSSDVQDNLITRQQTALTNKQLRKTNYG
jgi:hypothetical protein